MVARAKAHLTRYERLTGKGEGQEEIWIRGLLIDKTARRVLLNGREIMLTAKEYDLLVLLAANPGRVFRKEELFDRVWGLEAVGDLATLTVHIRNIREKIEADPSNPQYIETIWASVIG